MIDFPGTALIGKPLFGVFSLRWEGLEAATGDPQGYDPAAKAVTKDYAAINKNTLPEDLVYHGPGVPVFFGGVRNTIDWKNFSFSFNVTYKLGYYFRRASIHYSNLFTLWGGHADYAQRWQQAGDELKTYVPSAPAGQSFQTLGRDDFYRKSAILVEKGDHIRLQDIRLGYELNNSRIKRLPFKRAMFFIYVNNLGILWRANEPDIDPDYGNTVIPPSRSIAIGLNCNF